MKTKMEICGLSRIRSREATVGVVGLGPVGLTVAAALADAGFRVVGVDVLEDRVLDVDAGRFPLPGEEPELPELLARVTASGRLTASTSAQSLAEADAVLVAVDTPVADDRRPDLSSLTRACSAIAAVLKPGALVVVESTVPPGTCERVLLPLFEAAQPRTSGAPRRHGVDFLLGHCPERVMLGRLLENLRGLPRACGGASPEAARAVVALYETIVRAPLEACDCVTAELVKTAENAYRDVNIAFANELARICEAAGGDFPRVRELVNRSPGRHLLWAGAGVGGHCIPKDPWLLADALRGEPPASLLVAARQVNDGMPLHVACLAERALGAAGVRLRGARIAVLGYSYLEGSGDTRSSPSRALVAHLEQQGATVLVHDPWARGCARDLFAVADGANAAILMVAHQAYRALDLARLSRTLATPILVDGRFVVDPGEARAAGLVHVGVGRRKTSG